MTVSSPATPLEEQQHIVLHDVSWEFYEQLLKELENRPIQVTFDNGSLEIMAPLHIHEVWKKRIGGLVEVMCEELDLDIEPSGSTTFRRRDAVKGLEPDECYYVNNAGLIRGKRELDLTRDPPPDLAIEIEITRRSIPKQPVYAGLGIPELWRFNGKRLTILILKTGKYGVTANSLAFPFLPIVEFQQFVLRLETERRPRVLRDFRKWLRSLDR
ncbi:MAG TPA: Uma2 family endonuclease [Tepidisphaeraceae bacterium]|nr:Uma2 family endonuclease [Tepidisphaeraceae bacterium]